MKSTLWTLFLPTTAALQSGYLSQLTTVNGGNYNGAQVNGAAFNGAHVNRGSTSTTPPASPAFVSSSSSGGPSQKLLNLWSDQVSVELAASQLYLSASIWFNNRDLKGMSAWMLEESGEERGHGLAILDFAKKKKFPINLKTLVAPKSDWQTPDQVWEDILQAEKTNTQNLLKLAAAADECGEYGCMAFLEPFHIEQIEAEEKVGSILAKLKGAPNLLVELDHRLGIEAEEEEGH